MKGLCFKNWFLCFYISSDSKYLTLEASFLPSFFNTSPTNSVFNFKFSPEFIPLRSAYPKFTPGNSASVKFSSLRFAPSMLALKRSAFISSALYKCV